ncbi:MAG: hypothetical protein D6696_19085 [Acidobacteria bacterium]|nr:MAG: hypothetical protein D6696_19085 [Acidobacteriota bacterium]
MTHSDVTLRPSRRRLGPVLATMLALLLALALPATAQTERWIHVKVEPLAGDDGETVTVNLPLSLLAAAAAMIPQEVIADAHDQVEVELDEMHMSWQQLRDLWQQVRSSPDATYVTVETKDEHVRVWKEGDYMLIKTTESQGPDATQVDVQFPLAVVDALFSGPENTLNISAALHALADHGPGNLVSVRDGEQTVRIWIDDQNESDRR